MKKNSVLYLVAAAAFVVASVFSFIEYFTGTRESALWMIMGCVFFIAALLFIRFFAKSPRKEKQ